MGRRLPTDRVAVRCSHRRNSRTYVLDPEPGEAVFVVKAGTEVVLLREGDRVVDKDGEEIMPTGKFYRTVETIDPYHAVLDIW